MENTNIKCSKSKVQKDCKMVISQIRTNYDICIIGGGASGITAAIVAAENNPKASICIIEKKAGLGKKLLATGNGRCNITNNQCEDFKQTEDFLLKQGILIKEEAEGRMYPKSEQATSVLELLELQIKRWGIHVIVDASVLSVSEEVAVPASLARKTKSERNRSGFILTIEQSGKETETTCKTLLIATGGKAAPQFGTTGDGYRLARKLGHTVVKVAPILMPICCEGIEKELKGVRSKACVTLLKSGQAGLEKPEMGEVQFTEDGLSGICIFNLSRYIKLEDKDIAKLNGCFEEAFRQYEIEIDFVPDMEELELIELLKNRQKNLVGLPAKTILMSLVNTAIADNIIKKAMHLRKEEEDMVEHLSETQLKKVVNLLKKSKYTVTGGKGWKSAQCTSGGVSLEEINRETMESKLVGGLYFAGEVLDYDGPCGGYNLQHAWVTGIKAGSNMATAVKKELENRCTE